MRAYLHRFVPTPTDADWEAAPAPLKPGRVKAAEILPLLGRWQAAHLAARPVLAGPHGGRQYLGRDEAKHGQAGGRMRQYLLQWQPIRAPEGPLQHAPA